MFVDGEALLIDFLSTGLPCRVVSGLEPQSIAELPLVLVSVFNSRVVSEPGRATGFNASVQVLDTSREGAWDNAVEAFSVLYERFCSATHSRFGWLSALTVVSAPTHVASVAAADDVFQVRFEVRVIARS